MAARGCTAAVSLQIMLSMLKNKPQVSLAMMVSETTPNVIHGSFVPQNPHSWLVQPFLPALQTLKSETLSLQLSGGVSVLTSSVGRHSNLTSDFLLVPQIRLQLTTVCNYAYIIYTALAYLLLTYRPQNFADNRLQHMLHIVKLPNKTDRLHTDWNTSRSLSTPSHHLHQTVGVPPSHRTWRVPGGLHLQTPPRDRAGTGRAVRAEWLDHTHTHREINHINSGKKCPNHTHVAVRRTGNVIGRINTVAWRTKLCQYNWHSSLSWPFQMLKYKYTFQIKKRKHFIKQHSETVMVWNTKMQIAV